MDMAGFRYFLIRMIYLLFIKFTGWDCVSAIQFYSFGKHRLGIAGAFFLPTVRNVNMKSPPGQFSFYVLRELNGRGFCGVIYLRNVLCNARCRCDHFPYGRLAGLCR